MMQQSVSDIPISDAHEHSLRKIARLAFLLAAFAAAGWLLSNEWNAILTGLATANLALIALALLAAISNVILTGLYWRTLLMYAPIQPSIRSSARIFFIGQIGKYLPGTVWSFLASSELAKQAGFPRATTISSFVLALIIGLVTGAAIAALTLTQIFDDNLPILPFIIGISILVLLGLRQDVRAFVLRLAKIDFPIPISTLCLSGIIAVLAWGLAGVHVLLLANAVEAGLDWTALPQLTGAYAFAWVAGFAVVIAPAGLGAREGALLVTLSLTMGLPEATIVVLLSRLVVTIADFCCAGAAMLISDPKAS
ncbi:MAG: lysylphosphatidylglycerol synthase domain-containing protein [Pseudomonadota bacterium]